MATKKAEEKIESEIEKDQVPNFFYLPELNKTVKARSHAEAVKIAKAQENEPEVNKAN